MQSMPCTSGCSRVNSALAWCCVPSETARCATIIIKVKEVNEAGNARLCQLLRYSFAGLLQRSQSCRHKDQRRAKDALARRCVVGCALYIGRIAGLLCSWGVHRLSLFGVTGNGAPPHSLWAPNRRDSPSGSPLSKFGPFVTEM